jgi:ABC-type multidrug transport system fused ATPase/permease subunit
MAQTRRTSSEYSASGSGSRSSISSEIKVEDEEKTKARGVIYGYVFSTWAAKFALLPSAAVGLMPILMYFMFGDIINAITKYYMTASGPNPYDPMDEIWDQTLKLIYVAIGTFIAKFLDTLLWIRIGSYLSTRLKDELFANMMRSDVTFFDVNPIGGVLTLLSEDSQQVQDAFGQVKGTQISNLAQFLFGIIMAFTYDWRMALIALCAIPFVGLIMGFLMPTIIKQSNIKFKFTASSMTIAEETLSSIRTVKGNNREDVEAHRFLKDSEGAAKAEVRIGYCIIGLVATIQLGMWGFSIINLWYGAGLVDKGDLLVGDMFSVFGFTMMGVLGVIMLQGTMQGEQKAIAAGARILKLAHYISDIPFEGGEIIDPFTGHIEFQNVSFKYPTRDVYVLKNVSFEIKPCQMGALVGHSGSGKSTIVQLLERFYDISEGVILLDGKDIKTLDPHWLHQRIGLVQQEPSLFIMSVEENIKYGAKTATHEQVVEAARIANAQGFIEKLDHKYDQQVGEKGSALSGGQRQRVAIARAVIKDPAILITDEATSALDADSERKVQIALDRVMENRTAVVVAHRLSTIRNAQVIYVFDAGEIKEIGTHDSLLKLNGYYYNLVRRQLAEAEEGKGGISRGSKRTSSSAAPPPAKKQSSAGDAAATKPTPTPTPAAKKPAPAPAKPSPDKKQKKPSKTKESSSAESDSDPGFKFASATVPVERDQVADESETASTSGDESS